MSCNACTEHDTSQCGARGCVADAAARAEGRALRRCTRESPTTPVLCRSAASPDASVVCEDAAGTALHATRTDGSGRCAWRQQQRPLVSVRPAAAGRASEAARVLVPRLQRWKGRGAGAMQRWCVDGWRTRSAHTARGDSEPAAAARRLLFTPAVRTYRLQHTQQTAAQYMRTHVSHAHTRRGAARVRVGSAAGHTLRAAQKRECPAREMQLHTHALPPCARFTVDALCTLLLDAHACNRFCSLLRVRELAQPRRRGEQKS